MNSLRITLIIVLMLNLFSLHTTAESVKTSKEPPHLVLDQWKAAVDQKFGARQIKPATASHEFTEIRNLQETSVLIKLINENYSLEEVLLIRIKNRCQKIETNQSYAEKYYSFLLCEAKGISVPVLLKLSGAHEQVLDHIIAALFLDGESDSSGWLRSFRPAGGNGLELKGGDPFDK